MAIKVLTNAKIYLDGSDVTGDHNEIKLSSSIAMLDDTRFGQDTKVNTPGLADYSISGKGFWSAAALTSIDPTLFATIGGAGSILSVSPDAGAVGDMAYILKTLNGSYMVGASVGDALPFEISAGARGTKLVRATVGAIGSKVAGTATGAAQNLGLLASGKSLYVAAHVTSITGSVLIDIVSDDNSGLTTPITRLSLTSIAAAGAQWASLAGPIATDTWWAVKTTVTTGPATVFISIGIL